VVPADPLFPSSRGRQLSRDALEQRLAPRPTTAARFCPSLRTKRVTPHVLRHSATMRLLQAGVETTVIALWLGHGQVETTQIYLHADLKLKEQVLARMNPLNGKPGRHTASDAVLAFLGGL
jgi:integrase/recombinase XerD